MRQQLPVKSNRIREGIAHTTAKRNAGNFFPALAKKAPQMDEMLVKDESTNEFYMTLRSTEALKREKEKLYVPLNFKNSPK